MSQYVARIPLNRYTKNHTKVYDKFGLDYEIQEEEYYNRKKGEEDTRDVILLKVDGFHIEPVHLSSPDELMQFVEELLSGDEVKVCTYYTQFYFDGNGPHSTARFAAPRLEDWVEGSSAILTKADPAFSTRTSLATEKRKSEGKDDEKSTKLSLI